MRPIERHSPWMAALLVAAFILTGACSPAFADQPATPLQQPQDPDPAVPLQRAQDMADAETDLLTHMAQQAAASASSASSPPPTGTVVVSGDSATPNGVRLTFTVPGTVEARGSWGDGVWGNAITMAETQTIDVGIPPWAAGPQRFYVQYRVPGKDNPWSPTIGSNEYRYNPPAAVIPSSPPPAPPAVEAPPHEEPKASTTMTTGLNAAGDPTDTTVGKDAQGHVLFTETLAWDPARTHVLARTQTTVGVDATGRPQTTTTTFDAQDRVITQEVKPLAPPPPAPIAPLPPSPAPVAPPPTPPTPPAPPTADDRGAIASGAIAGITTVTNAAGHPVDATIGTDNNGQPVSQETLEWDAARTHVLTRTETTYSQDAQGRRQVTTSVFGERDQLISQTVTPPPPVKPMSVEAPPSTVVPTPPPAPPQPPIVAPPPAPVTPPPPPPALAVTKTSTVQTGGFPFAHLTVTANQPFVKVIVQYRQADRAFTGRAPEWSFASPVTTKTVTLEPLALGATYEYFVRVVDAQGRTADSELQTFFLPALPPATPPVRKQTRPTVPPISDGLSSEEPAVEPLPPTPPEPEPGPPTAPSTESIPEPQPVAPVIPPAPSPAPSAAESVSSAPPMVTLQPEIEPLPPEPEPVPALSSPVMAERPVPEPSVAVPEESVPAATQPPIEMPLLPATSSPTDLVADEPVAAAAPPQPAEELSGAETTDPAESAAEAVAPSAEVQAGLPIFVPSPDVPPPVLESPSLESPSIPEDFLAEVAPEEGEAAIVEHVAESLAPESPVAVSEESVSAFVESMSAPADVVPVAPRAVSVLAPAEHAPALAASPIEPLPEPPTVLDEGPVPTLEITTREPEPVASTPSAATVTEVIEPIVETMGPAFVPSGAEPADAALESTPQPVQEPAPIIEPLPAESTGMIPVAESPAVEPSPVFAEQAVVETAPSSEPVPTLSGPAAAEPSALEPPAAASAEPVPAAAPPPIEAPPLPATPTLSDQPAVESPASMVEPPPSTLAESFANRPAESTVGTAAQAAQTPEPPPAAPPRGPELFAPPTEPAAAATQPLAPPTSEPKAFTTTTTSTNAAGHPVDTTVGKDAQGNFVFTEELEWNAERTHVLERTQTTYDVDARGNRRETTHRFDARDRLTEWVVTTIFDGFSTGAGLVEAKNGEVYDSEGRLSQRWLRYEGTGDRFALLVTYFEPSSGHMTREFEIIGNVSGPRQETNRTYTYNPDGSWRREGLTVDSIGRPLIEETVMADSHGHIIQQNRTLIVLTGNGSVVRSPFPWPGRVTYLYGDPSVATEVRQSFRSDGLLVSETVTTYEVLPAGGSGGVVIDTYTHRNVDGRYIYYLVDVGPPNRRELSKVVRAYGYEGSANQLSAVTTTASRTLLNGTQATEQTAVGGTRDEAGRVTAVAARPIMVTAGGQTVSGTGFAAIQQHPDGGSTAVQGTVAFEQSAAGPWQVQSVEASATIRAQEKGPYQTIADVKATQQVSYTPDGKFEKAAVTGYTVTGFGAKVIRKPDGVVEFYYPVDPGPYVTRKADGTIQLADGGGTTRQTLPDGTSVLQHPSGLSWRIRPDGAIAVVRAPGDATWTRPGAEIALLWQNDTFTVTTPDGTRAQFRPEQFFGATTFLIEELERLQARR